MLKDFSLPASVAKHCRCLWPKGLNLRKLKNITRLEDTLASESEVKIPIRWQEYLGNPNPYPKFSEISYENYSSFFKYDIYKQNLFPATSDQLWCFLDAVFSSCFSASLQVSSSSQSYSPGHFVECDQISFLWALKALRNH